MYFPEKREAERRRSGLEDTVIKRDRPVTAGKLTKQFAAAIAADQYLENSVIFPLPPADVSLRRGSLSQLGSSGSASLSARQASPVGATSWSGDDSPLDASFGLHSPDLAFNSGNVILVRKQRTAV